MRVEVFQYAIPLEETLDDLNSFLGQHRVVAIKHHLAVSGDRAFLVFVVEITGQADRSPAGPPPNKIDYKKELEPKTFAVFNRLRELRKKLAESEGVPVYTIFNNAQLADIVRQGVTDLEAMRRVEGVGEAKLEKYGESFLQVLNEVAKTDCEAPE